jgi:hypothetical protein
MQRGIRAAGVAAFLLFIGWPIPPLYPADRIWFVPWKVLDPGAAPAKSIFTLYWIPSSPEELRRSELVTSRTLAVYGARCVAMHVIRIDDGPRLAKIGPAELPAAVLVEGEREIARVGHENGALIVSQVEEMVRAEFEVREERANAALIEAKVRVKNGETAEAAALYETVVAQRCAFPRQAKEARRGLKRLNRP